MTKEGEQRRQAQVGVLPSLAELRGPLRTLEPSEVAGLDSQYVIQHPDGTQSSWVSIVGHSPQVNGGYGRVDVAPAEAHPGPAFRMPGRDVVSTVFQALHVIKEGKPWSRRCAQAHRPKGPGRFSHRKVGGW